MRSLAAWSINRRQHARQDEPAEFHSSEDATWIKEELLVIGDTLLDTLMLYGSVRMRGFQKQAYRQWVVEQGDLVSATISDQTEKIRSSLVRSLSDAVRPLLTDVIDKKAVSDFCGVMETVALRSTLDSAVITVPQRLHGLMLEELRRRGLQLHVESGDVGEIAFDSKETSLRSKIGDTVEELDGILNG
jgi:hypothetical protein